MATKKMKNEDKKELNEVIKYLRRNGINKETVKESIEKVNDLGFKYNINKFPELINTKNFDVSNSASPINLAEALLWKIGRWDSYVNFRKYYGDQTQLPKKDVVFYAFALHLANPEENPIFDQHTLRAMYAINENWSEKEDKAIVKHTLLTNNNNWKTTLSGKNFKKSYDIYCNYVSDVINNKHPATLAEIDHLLMTLGQAIKKCSIKELNL